MTNDDGSGFNPVPPPYHPPPGGSGQFGPPSGYPPYPAPPPRPAKKRWPWIVGGILAAVVLAVVVGLVVIFAVAKNEPQAVTVTYEVSGSGSAEVTYWGADGNRSNPVTVALPWKTEVTMRGDDTYVSLSVERPKSSEEPVKCRITAGGKVIQENQAEGIFLSCTGHLGSG
ncbi:MmpS family transport accessory protein [Mycobacterium sp. MMS18-G62]